MNMNTGFKKEIEVSFKDCDNYMVLSKLAVFNIVENAVTEYMCILKVDGRTAIEKYNGMWVYTKNKVNIYNDAHWQDKLTVTVDLSLIKSYKLYFDTKILLNNEVLATSKIELVAIDLATKTLRRCNTMGIEDSFQTGIPLDINYLVDKHIDEYKHLSNVLVQSTNIDYLQHTNNIEYVRFVLNNINIDKIQKISSIEALYMNQTHYLDTLDINLFESDTYEQYQISLNNDSAVIIRIEYGR